MRASFVLPLEFGADTGPHNQMADKWSAIIENSTSGHSAIIDVNVWLGKATLDACVMAFAFCMRGLRVNHELISQQDRHRGFRLRFRRPGRCGKPVYQVIHELSVRPPICVIRGPSYPSC